MDSQNVRNAERICGKDRDGKIYRLLDFTEEKRDVADPWYTGNFDKTYEDILKGLEAFLDYLNYFIRKIVCKNYPFFFEMASFRELYPDRK